MIRSLLCVVLCLLAGSLCAPLAAAQTAPRVNESATRATVESGRVVIALAINNPSPQSVTGRVKLELLDTRNRVQSAVERDEPLPAGAATLTLALPLPAPLAGALRDLFWYRLRYQIAGGVTGIIALSEIAPEPFELSVTLPPLAYPNAPCRTRVRATHPTTGSAAGGVRVRGELTIEHETQPPLTAEAVTNDEGVAVFEFNLPGDIKSQDGSIKVTGERSGFTATAESNLLIDHFARLALSTDKPLYQPGQTLHLRALVLDSARRAATARTLAIKIFDPEETTIYRATATTSRFGVASLDWLIPENVRLGDYSIRCQLNDSEEEIAAPLNVRISRYELPNFVVNVKADRAYYLPKQKAAVVVRGDYLFGQPLVRGHVRVVRETSRNWNFREQKWEIEEEDKQEGDLDGAGRFVARIDLREAHAELAENDYQRFRDIGYTAYITDLTTNRTEQRRFDLRVSKAALHVYVIEPRNHQESTPLDFYVSTFYADGTPAVCDVAISERYPSANRRNQARARRLGTVRTNRYGVAKVSRLATARHSDDGEPTLRLAARDGRGNTASHSQEIDYDSHPAIRLETGRTIYHAGEPLRLHLQAGTTNANAFVEVRLPRRPVLHEQVALRNGEAELTIPYRDDFKGEVVIAACAYQSDGRLATGERTVLYSHDRRLKLDVEMSAARYRPGQEASATLAVRAADGRAAESALGVVAVDRAVEERAVTDSQSGTAQGFLHAYEHLTDSRDTAIAGITVDSLNRLDPVQAIPEDLDLVAEILLLWYGPYYNQETSDEYQTGLQHVFDRLTAEQLRPVKEALDRRYDGTGEYPRAAGQLRRLLDQFGLDVAAVRDPWGTAYRTDFNVEGRNDRLRFISAGADKRFGTADDFTALTLDRAYFLPHGKAIDQAAADYHRGTGRFLRDHVTLRRELAKAGVDINTLRDRWGQPYRFRFGINRRHYTIEVVSGGPDRRIETGGRGAGDFMIWQAMTDYFAEPQEQIGAALTAYFKTYGQFPQNDAELNRALAESHLSRDALRDGWERPLYVTFKSQSRYAPRVRQFTVTPFGQATQQKTEITPVTQVVNYITLRSAGADGKPGTYDDFDLANYSQVVFEQALNESAPRAVRVSFVISGQAGAIAGLVRDPQGALVPNVTVTATHKPSGNNYVATTDLDGRYLIKNVPAGQYDIRFDSEGFKSALVIGVAVQADNVTEVSASLEIGATAETVTVTANADATQTQTGTIAAQAAEPPLKGGNFTDPVKRSPGAVKPAGELSTPRLRQYFPETLVWQPSLETDEQGRASLKFKLADNITTWRLAVVASTVDGRIGTAQTDVLAFQPFFIEHDPPRVLTEGDEISLPVVVRNYLDRRQTVELEFSPAAWFQLLGPTRRRVEVNAGDAARATFDFRAIASIKDGPQRVAASSPEANDAIEKRVAVHPDGDEITATTSQVFGESAALLMNIPDRAIAGTARGELKIYPNLSAHVLEAIEAIMQRPYGCAEQTLSSAYPSLLALRLYENHGGDASATARRARRYLQSGYERLLSYRDAAGGFSYWGRGKADPALTAYAIQFLNDAARFISVDEEVLPSARDWLVKQQRADGSWPVLDWQGREDRGRTAMLTALAARSLAGIEAGSTPDDTKQTSRPVPAYLQRTLDYLSQRAEEIDEPYLIAAFALAAKEARQRDRAARAVARLTALARNESSTSYWALETNTPFYGWGLAGRIETTALAVQALASQVETHTTARRASDNELINRGLLFLLRQKDRYGVWHSTQATVQALGALTAVLSTREPDAMQAGDAAEIIVNGKRAASLRMPRRDEVVNPLTLDVSAYLATGDNRIEIRRPASAAEASAQLVTSHYERWREAARESHNPLRLKVAFDKTELKAGDEVSCRVEAERVGFQGYGMMLAEVGLPPGADLDRASLERAMTESEGDLNRYDVLPDRVVVYLWPRGGGTRFTFKFKLRYGLKAQTAPSLLYDYYNPEARVELAPVRFRVR